MGRPSLRSSPAPEGRCWRWKRHRYGLLLRVAILTGSGGPVLGWPHEEAAPGARVLRSSPAPEGRCWRLPTVWRRPRWRRCDPHRPRRAGAGRGMEHGLCGRAHVAILTGPGGPVLVHPAPLRSGHPGRCDPHRPRRAGAGTVTLQVHIPPAQVAILTGPGGPVLAESRQL